MREHAIEMVALCQPTANANIRVELIGAGAHDGFSVGLRDFTAIGKASNERMSFGQASQFLRRGKRVSRKGWDDLPFGGLVILDGKLVWEYDASMSVILPGEDLLATDWVVM